MSKVYEYATQRILDLLDKGLVPWKQTWNSAVGMPRNGITGIPYRGINVWICSAANFDKPFWYTMKQIKAKGARVQKGEKATQIFFFKMNEIKDDNGNVEKRFPLFRYYNVWNFRQIDDIPEPEGKAIENPFSEIESAQQLADDSPLKSIVSVGHAKARYVPVLDRIEMPSPTCFTGAEYYYSTLFHEMAHGTGHDSRLSRDLSGIFGDHSYSKEELIAEMTATFLCSVSGIENMTIEASASYINHWRKKISDDPKLIVQAGTAAQKAADYIIGTHI
jgi:antirestriction protein ArdC